MEPFSIYCTTCHARLRVRKAAAIDTIVACPKCSGMVLVERPTAGAPAPNPPRKSTPASRSGSSAAFFAGTPDDHAFEKVGDLFAGDDENHPTEVAAAAIPSPLAERIHAEHFDDAVAAAETIGTEPPLEAPSPEAASPQLAWTSPAMLRWRPVILAAGAGMLGIIGAIGVIRLMVGVTVAQNAPATVAPISESIVENDKPGTTINHDTVEASRSEPAPRTVTNQPEAPAADPLASTESVSHVEPAGNPAETAADSPLTGDAPKPQDRFAELVDLPDQPPPRVPTVEPAPAANDDDDVDVDPAPTEFESSYGIAIVNKGAQKPFDVVERFQHSIPSIELTQIPLYRFTDLISDYTAVPITLRWESIMQAGTTVGRTVNVNAQDAAIGDLLRHVLTPLRLSVRRNGQHLEIKKRRDSNSLRVTRYLVADLVKPESSIEDLARLVQQLVAPGTWKRQGGIGQLAVVDGRLAIKHREAAHFETLMLFEQLRIARGQRPLSSYPPELFQLVDRRDLLREVLARPVRLRRQKKVRLADLLRQVGETAGCVILPNWVAIADVGWTPETELQVELDEMSFDEVLRQLGAALELTYRVLDSRTIEITSPRAEQVQAEFSFHDLGLLRDAGFDVATLSERIQQAIGVEPFRAAGGVVAIDAASDHAIVRLPQSLQVLVRDFLTTWGA